LTPRPGAMTRKKKRHRSVVASGSGPATVTAFCEDIAVTAPTTITDAHRRCEPDHSALWPRRWRMAILPSWQAGFQSAGNLPAPPPAPTASPPPPFNSPTRAERPRGWWRVSKLPPANEKASAGVRRTKAGKTGGMVCGVVKARAASLKTHNS
jgi:hypothetical protein